MYTTGIASACQRYTGNNAIILAMNPFRYRVSLRLCHPKMDPEDISVALKMKPQFQWKAGERRTTPQGRPLEGINSVTYWCSQGIEGQGFGLAESLSTHLHELETNAFFLKNFVSSGGSIEYFIGWFTDGLMTGATLDSDLLSRMSALNIDMGLDVYGGKDPSIPTADDGV